MIIFSPILQFTQKIFSSWRFPLATLLVLTLASCTIGNYTEGTLQRLTSQPLSLNDPDFRTCVFDPPYSIVHFPMYHYPSNGHYTTQTYEKVVRSQFQLLHTILDYNRSYWNISVFDESFTTDTYNQTYFQSLLSGQSVSDSYQRIDGQVFVLGERMRRAEHLFRSGFPRYYEHLSTFQKDFLFNTGASFTLYLLGQIPRIHKVIPPNQFLLVKNYLLNSAGQLDLQGNSYWIYDFREEELKKEVLSLFQGNYSPQSIFLIAYGASHDFSDEFASYPFQSGHNFCLSWEEAPGDSLLPLP